MNKTVSAWDIVYTSNYGRRYPFEPLIVYVQRLKNREFISNRSLDIGFGTIADMVMLHSIGYEICGIEVSKNAIEKAKLALSSAGVPCDLKLWVPGTSFPYENQSFDLVTSIGALHYNLDQELVLSEIHRVLRIGGRFMITYHGPLFYYWHFTEIISPSVRRYTDEYPNESMRGIEFVYFEKADEIHTLYAPYFLDVEVSHYQYRVLGQDTSFWLVTGSKN